MEMFIGNQTLRGEDLKHARVVYVNLDPRIIKATVTYHAMIINADNTWNTIKDNAN